MPSSLPTSNKDLMLLQSMDMNNQQSPGDRESLPMMNLAPKTGIEKMGLGEIDNTEESITYDIFDQNYKKYKRN